MRIEGRYEGRGGVCCGYNGSDGVSKIIGSYLAHAEVVGTDVTIYGTRNYISGPDPEALYRIRGLIENLDGLSRLGAAVENKVLSKHS